MTFLRTTSTGMPEARIASAVASGGKDGEP